MLRVCLFLPSLFVFICRCICGFIQGDGFIYIPNATGSALGGIQLKLYAEYFNNKRETDDVSVGDGEASIARTVLPFRLDARISLKPDQSSTFVVISVIDIGLRNVFQYFPDSMYVLSIKLIVFLIFPLNFKFCI